MVTGKDRRAEEKDAETVVDTKQEEKKQTVLIQREIAATVKAGNMLIGSTSVLSALKGAKVQKVFTAANCPPRLMEHISYYTKKFAIPHEKMPVDAEVLGEWCGKPFTTLVLGVKK